MPLPGLSMTDGVILFHNRPRPRDSRGPLHADKEGLNFYTFSKLAWAYIMCHLGRRRP